MTVELLDGVDRVLVVGVNVGSTGAPVRSRPGLVGAPRLASDASRASSLSSVLSPRPGPSWRGGGRCSCSPSSRGPLVCRAGTRSPSGAPRRPPLRPLRRRVRPPRPPRPPPRPPPRVAARRASYDVRVHEQRRLLTPGAAFRAVARRIAPATRATRSRAALDDPRAVAVARRGAARQAPSSSSARPQSSRSATTTPLRRRGRDAPRLRGGIAVEGRRRPQGGAQAKRHRDERPVAVAAGLLGAARLPALPPRRRPLGPRAPADGCASTPTASRRLGSGASRSSAPSRSGAQSRSRSRSPTASRSSRSSTRGSSSRSPASRRRATTPTASRASSSSRFGAHRTRRRRAAPLRGRRDRGRRAGRRRPLRRALLRGRSPEARRDVTWLPRELAGPTSVLVRAGMVLVSIVLAAPLITGTDDGALSRAGVVALVALGLACTPVLACAAAGVPAVFLRRLKLGRLRRGRRSHAGVVRDVTLLEFVLEDDVGCEVRVPQLLGLWHPTRILGSAATATIQIAVDPHERPAKVEEAARPARRWPRASARASTSSRSTPTAGAGACRAFPKHGKGAASLAEAVAQAIAEQGIGLGRAPERYASERRPAAHGAARPVLPGQLPRRRAHRARGGAPLGRRVRRARLRARAAGHSISSAPTCSPRSSPSCRWPWAGWPSPSGSTSGTRPSGASRSGSLALGTLGAAHHGRRRVRRDVAAHAALPLRVAHRAHPSRRAASAPPAPTRPATPSAGSSSAMARAGPCRTA